MYDYVVLSALRLKISAKVTSVGKNYREKVGERKANIRF